MNFLKLKNINIISAIAFSAILSGCVTFPTLESEKVSVVWDDAGSIEGCDLVGPVIGSEGHFYDYWFHADRDMLWGTLNQMRIKAAEMGGDKIYLFQPLPFSSSVTKLANVYACSETAKLKSRQYLVMAEEKAKAKAAAEARKNS